MKRLYLIPAVDLLIYCAATVFAVATAWWISIEGGASDLVFYSALQAIFLMVLTPCLAPFGEKLDRTLLLMGTVILLVLRTALCIGSSLHGYNIEILITASLLDSVAMALYMPVSRGILPDLMPKEQLSSALSLQKRYQQIGSVVGPIIAGWLLVMTFGYLYAYCAVALFSVTALAVLVTHKKIIAEANKPNKLNHNNEPWGKSLIQGFRSLIAIPVELGWNIRSFFLAALLVPLFVTFLPLYVKENGYSGFWFGILQLAFSLGAISATFAYQNITRYIPRPHISMLSLSITGLSLMLFANSNNLSGMFALLCLSGCMFTMNQLNGQSHRLLAIPSNMRVRFTAISFTSVRLATTLGIALAGALLEHISVGTLYTIFGSLSIVFALTTVLIPGYYEFMSLSKNEADGYYQRKFSKAFPGM